MLFLCLLLFFSIRGFVPKCLLWNSLATGPNLSVCWVKLISALPLRTPQLRPCWHFSCWASWLLYYLLISWCPFILGCILSIPRVLQNRFFTATFVWITSAIIQLWLLSNEYLSDGLLLLPFVLFHLCTSSTTGSFPNSLDRDYSISSPVLSFNRYIAFAGESVDSSYFCKHLLLA